MEDIPIQDLLEGASRANPFSLWFPLPEVLLLGNDEVHVWRATLNVEISYLHNLQQLLSADEQVRAGRFYFQKDRERFIITRGLLRRILGRYLEREPGQLQFGYGPYGKPYLTGEFSYSRLRFNLAYSQELALYAITQGREVGIDIEYIRPHPANMQIAHRFFSPCEVMALKALPFHLQQEAFFNCWTRKEAYIKARGKGLSFPLNQFSVSLAPGEPAALLNVLEDPQETSRWSLQTLEPGSGYVAALAVEGQDWRLKCWQVQG
ncbi:MAG TPA: 4'-phosphopantetheinyl transferase superfamily protein [Candidatus Limnocylindrales bacterium]|nr:4'-phosphopantetheinyl transferase superfamily protein [Candidatus Limnocylindrales bacterium]